MGRSMNEFSRRRFTATAAGIAVGVFAAPMFRVAAQDATPGAESAPRGFISTRVRTVESDEQRDAVNEMVFAGFIQDVRELEGYRGYVLGDVIGQPGKSLSILVLENESQQAGFDALAAEFVAGIEEEVTTVSTEEWSGELLIAASARQHGSGTPPQKPGAGPLTQGYVVVRVHESAPDMDSREMVPLISADFLPIVGAIDGFRGYLWYPTEDGFVSITLFDSEEAAMESNEVKTDWISENLADYVAGEGEVFNAIVRFASLPVLG